MEEKIQKVICIEEEKNFSMIDAIMSVSVGRGSVFVCFSFFLFQMQTFFTFFDIIVIRFFIYLFAFTSSFNPYVVLFVSISFFCLFFSFFCIFLNVPLLSSLFIFQFISFLLSRQGILKERDLLVEKLNESQKLLATASKVGFFRCVFILLLVKRVVVFMHIDSDLCLYGFVYLYVRGCGVKVEGGKLYEHAYAVYISVYIYMCIYVYIDARIYAYIKLHTKNHINLQTLTHILLHIPIYIYISPSQDILYLSNKNEELNHSLHRAVYFEANLRPSVPSVPSNNESTSIDSTYDLPDIITYNLKDVSTYKAMTEKDHSGVNEMHNGHSNGHSGSNGCGDGVGNGYSSSNGHANHNMKYVPS